MAAKDKACGNNLVALKDLELGDLGKGTWQPTSYIDAYIDCTDQKWIGAPDPADHLKNHLGDDTCSDHVARWTIGAAVEPWPARNRYQPRGWYLMPFHWYQVIAYVAQLGFLAYLTWRCKEEVVKARRVLPWVPPTVQPHARPPAGEADCA
tara:strand:+ start:465 stop:917 length:453 start_codon:yes stop_codon:yes gene_type:complete